MSNSISFVIGGTYFARLYFIDPPGDLRTLKNKRVLLQVLNIVSDALFEVTEFQEINLLHSSGVVWLCIRNNIAELRRRECQHAASSMMENRNLARAQKALRDDDASQGVPPGSRDSKVRVRLLKEALANVHNATGVTNDMGVPLLEAKLREGTGLMIRSK